MRCAAKGARASGGIARNWKRQMDSSNCTAYSEQSHRQENQDVRDFDSAHASIAESSAPTRLHERCLLSRGVQKCAEIYSAQLALNSMSVDGDDKLVLPR